jgi:hypothetical protein
MLDTASMAVDAGGIATLLFRVGHMSGAGWSWAGAGTSRWVAYRSTPARLRPTDGARGRWLRPSRVSAWGGASLVAYHHASRFYRDDAYARLRRLRAEVDPDGVIVGNHPIPPAPGAR